MNKTLRLSLPILLGFTVLLFVLVIPATSRLLFATTVASPPNPAELVGVWIGYAEADGEFVRVEFKTDMTGVCAIVPSPAILGAQPADVDVYPISRWRLDGWKLAIDLDLANSRGDPIKISGTSEIYGTHVEISGLRAKWKHTFLLQKESSVNGPNLTAAEAIKENQHR